MKFLFRRIERARAEVWPAPRIGLPASTEPLGVRADPKCTRTCCAVNLSPAMLDGAKRTLRLSSVKLGQAIPYSMLVLSMV